MLGVGCAKWEEETSNSYMKIKHFIVVIALTTSAVGLSGCSSKSQEQAPAVVAQVPSASSAYNAYKQEIGALAQKAVLTKTIPAEDNHYGPYVFATMNTAVYDAAVQDLQNRIKGDTSIEGSDTTGKKGELLTSLKYEVATNGPFYAADAINKKTAELVYERCSNTGKEALKIPGVKLTIVTFRGEAALLDLNNSTDGTIGSDVQRLLSGPLSVSQ